MLPPYQSALSVKNRRASNSPLAFCVLRVLVTANLRQFAPRRSPRHQSIAPLAPCSGRWVTGRRQYLTGQLAVVATLTRRRSAARCVRPLAGGRTMKRNSRLSINARSCCLGPTSSVADQPRPVVSCILIMTFSTAQPASRLRQLGARRMDSVPSEDSWQPRQGPASHLTLRILIVAYASATRSDTFH